MHATLPRLGALVVSTGLVLAALSGCGDPEGLQERPATAGEPPEPLPAPEGAGGSITGMPDDPGPGRQPMAGARPEVVEPGEGHLPPGGLSPLPEGALAGGPPPYPGDALATGPGTPPAPPTPPVPPREGPGAGEAVGVVQSYYRSINDRNYDGAYALWSGGGSASGQSAGQFAGGFADTTGVSVEIMEPGRIEGAAGSRYIRVPVAVSSTREDGSVHRYVGSYTLKRSAVDGASADQQAWRIDSADIREVEN